MASLLGLGLLLVRRAFGRVGAPSLRAPKGCVLCSLLFGLSQHCLVYGAIFFLLLVGFAFLIPPSKWEKWVTGHKQRKSARLRRRGTPR